MLETWKIRVLKIQHRGPQDEVLSSQSIVRDGRFALADFARKLRIFKTRIASSNNSSQIEILKCGEGISISVPTSFGVRVNASESNPIESEIWSGKSSLAQRASFSWDRTPEQISIVFPNQSRVRIGASSLLALSLESPLAATVPLLLALGFHLIVGSLIALVPPSSPRPLHKIAVDLMPSKDMRRPLPQNKTSVSDRNSLASKTRSTKNLMNQFSLGKSRRLSSSNFAASETRSDAFADRSFRSSKSWGIDDELDAMKKKSLNLTESQVKAALQPAYRHLKECYEDLLIQDSSLKGQPQLKIDIAETGKISGVHLSLIGAKPQSLKKLQECFLAAYQRVQVPKPNRDFQVVHTLVLGY